MKARTIHIAFTIAAFAMFVVSGCMAAGLSSADHIKLEQQAYCNAPTITVSTEQHGMPFSGNGADHGGAGSKYISASDAVPHASVTAISSSTFAIVIALINSGKHDRPGRAPDVPSLTVFHKILFRSIISPNAP